MKKQLSVILLALCGITAQAQKLDYNIDFQYIFNNHEFDASSEKFDPSFTLNAARLTPSFGCRIEQNRHIHHRVMVGLDLYKNMGEGVRADDLRREMTIYYDIDAWFRNKGHFGAIAGMYPRAFMEGDYVGPFFDDCLLFTDCNMEGMAFKYRNERIYAEIGLDWMGMLGDIEHPLRRERFQVLSSGDWNFAGNVSLGWRGSFYHFACSPQSPNVIDNHMLHPYLKWSPDTWLDELSVCAGVVASYQRDRRASSEPTILCGALVSQKLSKWKVGIDNTFYFGPDLMPLYDNSYGGVKYGSDLYFGDECYHTQADGDSWCDILKLYYKPKLSKFVSISVATIFHIGQPSDQPAMRGSQQVVSLHLNLDALRPQPRPYEKIKLPGIFSGSIL